jgi:ribA/ribD-fused uncharacterized protein
VTVYFHPPWGELGCLSNFSRHEVVVDGRSWPTTEHYFQAQKFAGTPREEEIRRAKGPSAAAQLGRSRDLPLRPDWEQVKEEVMRVAVTAKAGQHEEVRAALLSTGDQELVEASPTDGYWGAGPDGAGRNALGRILMEVREQLRREG